MTENKPIIDGVDVSGCELYRNDNGVFAPDGTAERTELCYLTNDYCGNNTNCYYKQLALKKKECEYWKHQAELGSDTTDRLAKQLEEKEQECEELKNKLIQKDEINTFFNTPIEGWDNDPCKICESKQNYEQLKAENEECKKLNDISILHRICLDDDLQQAEQKLERIREAAKQMNNECFYDDFECKDCDMKNGCTSLNKSKILQIIDEVE